MSVKGLTPLQLETRFWGQNYLGLVWGGVRGSKGVKYNLAECRSRSGEHHHESLTRRGSSQSEKASMRRVFAAVPPLTFHPRTTARAIPTDLLGIQDNTAAVGYREAREHSILLPLENDSPMSSSPPGGEQDVVGHNILVDHHDEGICYIYVTRMP